MDDLNDCHPSPDSRHRKGDLESLWDGLMLVIKHDYVILVLGISCLFEVVLTVLDYEMKVRLVLARMPLASES